MSNSKQEEEEQLTEEEMKMLDKVDNIIDKLLSVRG